MRHRILSTPIRSSFSLVSIRDRSRQVGLVFGLDTIQCTRFVTAISELVRNAVQYADGGMLTFFVGDASESSDIQCVSAQIVDKGPGIPNASRYAEGRVEHSAGVAGMGIAGSRRLVDGFFINSGPDIGTSVLIEMYLPKGAKRVSLPELGKLVEQLTQRKAQSPVEELEQQNRDMLLTLQQLRRNKLELEEADVRKNEFLAMLAHELRNPLASISLSLDLAKRGGDHADILNVIGRQTKQLSRMVNDLLDVSRLTQGKVDLQTEVVHLSTVLDGAIEMTLGEITKRGHSIQFDADDSDFPIRGDVARLKQVFSNILHNAARYTHQPDVIEIAVTNDDVNAVVVVRDRGIGIDAAMLPHVFDLFTQGNTALGRQDAGLGIGLTVVQRLVRDHGGSVSVRSAGLGEGSEFVITLPLASEPVGALVDEDVVVEDAGNRTEHRILIVDDNQDSAVALSMVLEAEGYYASNAFDGQTALGRFADDAPRVCVIDIGLPDMSGFDVAKAMRAAHSGGELTLIALSGYSTEDFRDQAERAGFDHYFSKPLPLDEMLQLLARCH